jgi:mannose-1-phosphate guanylyltransferase/phosphomannomutase
MGARHGASMIRAMVMAAGAGTRLRPLTNHIAKPMIPLCGRPVLEYALLNLKRHGIVDVVLNLHAFPDQIRDYFGNGAKWGMHLTYSHEPTLLGTAGGVKKVEPFFQGHTFLVLSGDGVSDIDLTALIAFHRKRRSIATMALSPVHTRFDYGVTLAQASGRVTRFVEKPSWGDVFSNEVNTGIYVFEPSVLKAIPKGRVFDFGKQVWPALLRKKQPIYAWKTDAFWCDIGNLNEYRRAQYAFLDKALRIQSDLRERRPGIWADRDVRLKGIHIEAPCWIEAGARIDRGARIGPYAVIGRDAQVGKNSVLQRTIVWQNAKIGPSIRLHNAIVAEGVRVTASGSVLDGAVITKNDTLHASR